MDNILLTYVAPDFVVLEVLFALGWESKLHARCQKRIDANIAAFQLQSAKSH
jgi:uncharacterized membrane protein YGL010W